MAEKKKQFHSDYTICHCQMRSISFRFQSLSQPITWFVLFIRFFAGFGDLFRRIGGRLACVNYDNDKFSTELLQTLFGQCPKGEFWSSLLNENCFMQRINFMKKKNSSIKNNKLQAIYYASLKLIQWRKYSQFVYCLEIRPSNYKISNQN